VLFHLLQILLLLLPPLQRIAVAEDEATNAAGSVIVIDVVDVQPFASVTVYEYVPAVTVNVPCLYKVQFRLLLILLLLMNHCYKVSAVADDEATNAAGSVIVMLVVDVQPFASVTVYEYVPAVSVNVPVTCIRCCSACC
jgi:hypothetical protein